MTASTKKISEQAMPKGSAGNIAQQTIAAVRILVGGTPEKREFPAKDGRSASTIFARPAILSGGDVLQPWEVKAYDDEAKLLPEGVYIFGKNVLAVGKYNRLELKTYPENFVRVGNLSPEQEALFQAAPTDMSDIMGTN